MNGATRNTTGSRTRAVAATAFSIGALLACGSKTAPPSQSATAATDVTPAKTAGSDATPATANPGATATTQQASAPDPSAPAPMQAPVDATQESAPELSVTALGTTAVPSIQSLKGKVVILHFWASWCAPCTKAMPMLDAFAKKNKSKVVVIGISVDDDEASAKNFVATLNVKFPNGFDAVSYTHL